MADAKYEIQLQAAHIFQMLYPTLGGKQEELMVLFGGLNDFLDRDAEAWNKVYSTSPYKTEISKAYNETVELWGDTRMGFAALYEAIYALLKDCEVPQ